MCHECNALRREVEALRAGMTILRGQNIKLAVENNNLRNMTGVRMLPIAPGYLVEWERQQDGGAA